jgi:hypothetical protein
VAPVIAAGPVAGGDLSNAVRELYFALNARFETQMTAVRTSVPQSADAICGPHRDNTIATGTLQETTSHRRTQVTFNLLVYTCFGVELAHATGKGGSIKSAVDSAVTAYATAHPDNS